MQKIERFKFAWNFFNYLDDETFFGGGLDITNRCNLHCTHCYWWRQEKNPDLNDEQMIDVMKGLRRDGLRIIYLLGEKPFLKPKKSAEPAKFLTII